MFDSQKVQPFTPFFFWGNDGTAVHTEFEIST
jgi:hypothetical protein